MPRSPPLWLRPHPEQVLAHDVQAHAALPVHGRALDGRDVVELIDLQALVVQKNEAGRTWLGGEHFGPLDAYALTLTRWGTIAGIAPEVHPVLWAFVEQVAKVPAVARVIERERLQLNMSQPA